MNSSSKRPTELKTPKAIRDAMAVWRKKNPNYARQWRTENPERVALYVHRRQEKKDLARAAVPLVSARPPSKAPRACKRWTSTERVRFKKHGVTPEAFSQMAQSGCALCGVKAPRGKNSWHLDHDHETGTVRGILCITCNIALGMLHDDPARCRAAAAYLEFAKLL